MARRARWVTQSVLEELLVDGGPACADGPESLLIEESTADSAVWTSAADRAAPIPPLPWWQPIKVPRVTIDRETQASALFHVEQIVFQPNSGLYFLVDWRAREWEGAFNDALAFLADSGLGGERSAGHGQFTIRAHDQLKITPATAPNRLYTLGLYHPTPEEVDQGALDDARFDLEVRRGWMTGATGAALWRRAARMLAEGALIGLPASHPAEQTAGPAAPGSIVDVTPHGFTAHRVYRYGVALSLGARVPVARPHTSTAGRIETR